ncbi:MAG: 3-deoxy-7-phosphoheptulonate synthase [Clostridiales bacterium]|jgi:3-deoxy-7-phosphoheptulonate synthase|nr:3-deoxy-7-phosphoheptulonate synthase [Clostridiales bacterium]
MIIIMRPKAPQENIESVIEYIQSRGLKAHLSQGEMVAIIGVVGDKTRLDNQNIELLDGVEKIMPVTESFKLSNKKFKPDPTVIDIGGVKIGGGSFVVMAGPCAVEGKDVLLAAARAVKDAGAAILRGGAYKPRTSPYSFQGLEEQGLKFMAQAREETGLKIVCEVTSQQAVETAANYVDILQIGARNMQNYELLKLAGRTKIPVLLKRGLSATIEEWLNAAEYVMSEGNDKVILCERGIRTFETSTRNTLDISAVPVIKEKSHLPILVDPSHASGVRKYVSALSMAALASGADGLMIEVHPDPAKALSDGPQSLNPSDFKLLCEKLRPVAKLIGKEM